MSLVPLLGALAVASALPLALWALSGPSGSTSPAASRNLRAGTPGAGGDYRDAVLARSARERALDPVLDRLSRRARRLTPEGVLETVERRTLLAGAPAAWPVERVLVAKIAAGVLAAAATTPWFLGAPSAFRLLVVVAAAAGGYLLPDLLLHNAAEKRRAAIVRALPDLLDQLTISVEAGLAFEAATLRAGRSGTSPLHHELTRTMQDVQAGMSRSEAFRALVARTDVEDLRHFVLAMVQSEAYGVPLATVLRVQSGEMRVKRRQRAEEAATKLPVKMLFPIVVFILPALFVVLLGPAILQLPGTLG